MDRINEMVNDLYLYRGNELESLTSSQLNRSLIGITSSKQIGRKHNQERIEILNRIKKNCL